MLARCHHKLHNLEDALSFQQQIVALRPSISNLLLLAQMMAESETAATAATDELLEQRQARGAVLMRCIELCPVHASAWHQLALLFVDLASSSSAARPSDTSSPHPTCCCSRQSFLCCAQLTFRLVADLTNFTVNSHTHTAGDVPTLSTPLYTALLTSAEQHIAQLGTELTPAAAAEAAVDDTGRNTGGCMRCAGICACWRQRLHRFACLPLASLFVVEKEAEQSRVEGSKRTEKRRGRKRDDDDADSDTDEPTANVDGFDALNL